MILRDHDVKIDPCCDNLDNVVGFSVTFGQPLFSFSVVSSISTIMAKVHQVHQLDFRDDQNVTVLNKLPEGNKNY